MDVQPALLPRVGRAGEPRHRAAAHRLRPLRQQGGGEPRLQPRLGRGARLHLRDPRAGPAAQPALGLHARRHPARPLRRAPRPRRGAGARRRHVLPHRRGGDAERDAQPLHHGQHRPARPDALRAAAPRHLDPRLGFRALPRRTADGDGRALGAGDPQPLRLRRPRGAVLGAAPRRGRPDRRRAPARADAPPARRGPALRRPAAAAPRLGDRLRALGLLDDLLRLRADPDGRGRPRRHRRRHRRRGRKPDAAQQSLHPALGRRPRPPPRARHYR